MVEVVTLGSQNDIVELLYDILCSYKSCTINFTSL